MATATPVGTNAINSVTRRFVSPEITDQVYNSVLLLYRLARANKKKVQGGLHIEKVLNYRRMGVGGPYVGFDPLDTAPVDVWKNAAWAWKQYHVPVTFDGRSLLVNDSPEAIANLVEGYSEVAREEMQELLGNDLFSDVVTNDERIDGLQGAVDNGTVAATYGGLGARTTTNDFWQPDTGALDTTTAVLTLDALQTVFQAAVDGAQHPTIIITTDANYNRLWGALQPQQRFPSQAMGSDEQLAKAGFTNLLFNNVPVAVDPHCNANHIYFLNENYIEWVVHPSRDIVMTDFIQPGNQDAMTAQLLFMGNLVISNIRRQGKMNAVAA